MIWWYLSLLTRHVHDSRVTGLLTKLFLDPIGTSSQWSELGRFTRKGTGSPFSEPRNQRVHDPAGLRVTWQKGGEGVGSKRWEPCDWRVWIRNRDPMGHTLDLTVAWPVNISIDNQTSCLEIRKILLVYRWLLRTDKRLTSRHRHSK